MEPVPDGGLLVFVAGAWPVDRVIVHREQARSHMDSVYIKSLADTKPVGACSGRRSDDGVSSDTTSSKTSHNPDFNRLNARINARLNALPLSFLLYSEALTTAGGYVPGSLRIAGSIKPSAAVIALA